MMRLNKTNGYRSCSSMRSSVELAIVVFALVLMASGSVLADGAYNANWIAGKKFNISNIFPIGGDPPCAPPKYSTVAFYPAPYNGLLVNGTVTVVGQFAGAGFYVCEGTNVAVDPSLTIVYEIRGDWIVYRLPDRVDSASKVVPVKNGSGVAFINNSQFFYVSILTYAGQAN